MLTVDELECEGKTVFLRVDFNVPLEKNLEIRDDTRIRASLPTLNHLIQKNAKIIIASHLGRPKGKIVPELSMLPVARRLEQLISRKVNLAPDIIGDDVENMKNSLDENSVLLLENLRFHPGEKENDPEFARKLASKVDLYINDAFGTCHRAHASVVGISPFVKRSAAGYLVQKEIEYLDQVIHSPKKPYIAILGGAKVSDKIPVIRNLLHKADSLLIGGAMAFTFFAAQGFSVGRSLVESDKIDTAREIIHLSDKENIQILLPEDHVASSSVDDTQNIQTLSSFPFPDNLMGLDIGPNTIARYSEMITQAKTIFWNGPMGVFEKEEFSVGTTSIARAVADSPALSIVGGGDSVAAVLKAGVYKDISHISTGGGASLEYIANETLPGIEVLKEK